MQIALEYAYAKVNLFFGIVEKSNDGYHGVSTVMHSLSLADVLTIRAEKSLLPQIKLQVFGDDAVPEDSRNLVWKAADAFMKASGKTFSVSIRLEKHIPSQAGMGGGSSDAAATLRAMNRLAGYPFDGDRLCEIAATLGSDVPFCLYGGTALCTGRGEIVKRLPFAEKLYAVVLKGKESVSTPRAFAALDAHYHDFDGSVFYPPQRADRMAALARRGDTAAVAENLYNIFEDVIYPECPEASAFRDRLLAEGADGALLSGSGSAVFGLFGSREAAERAAERIGQGAVVAESAPESLTPDDAARGKSREKQGAGRARRALSIPIVQCALIALLLNFVIEIVCRRSFASAIAFTFCHPLYFLADFSMILITLSVALLFKKRYFMYILISTVWFALGMTNCILILVRTAPFEAVDFSILRTGLGIITVYMEIWQIVLVALLLLSVIGLIVYLGIRMKRQKRRLRDALIGIGGAALVTLSLILPMNLAGGYPSSFSNLSEAYDDYGFTYCFVCSIFDRGVDKPKGYGKAAIENLAAEIDQKRPVSVPTGNLPNVIFLQLESFIDVSRLKESVVRFSENPTPYFSSLKKAYSSGLLRVPTIGAGTANTEFEVVTGMSHHDFGTGEYPYKSFLQKKTCESVPFVLKEYGYTAHAIHNHTGTFYERNEAYAYLGFDTFIPLEYMTNVTYNELGWAKDEVLTEQIMNALRSTESSPDMLLTVSVQGHGKYAKMQGTPTVTASSELLDEDTLDGLIYYVNQLHEMDLFLQELTAALSAYDENVILVMYGDHLPSLGLSESYFESGDMYQTDYVIWSNFALERTERDLTSYQLASHALSMADISAGYILRLHQSKYADGIEQYGEELRFLEYDMLDGKRYVYGGKTPYKATDLQMGVLAITVSDVVCEGDDFRVLGENFTEWSVVCINGKKCKTTYRSENELYVEDKSVTGKDKITVRQITDDRAVLGVSNTFLID